MLNEYYLEAYRSAQKEYRRCLAAGMDPYLPVLDELVPAERMNSGIDLGLINVPSDLIIGTRTVGRTRSFARNFMPLLKEETEFARKWKTLCNAHVAEGIQNPVKVYEYLNRYYVEEGNKRVSVLKFFSAVTIPAQVIRILPAKVDMPPLYEELIQFEKSSGIYFMEFSKPGRYEELLQLLGKGKEEKWTGDEQKRFASTYYYFLRAFRSSTAHRSDTTPGDAMLAYMGIYGYESLKTAGETEIRRNIDRMSEDIPLMKEETPVKVQLQPEETRNNLLNTVLNMAAPKMRQVAFIYSRAPETSPWTRLHEEGRQHMQQIFSDRVVTHVYPDALKKGAAETIEEAIASGNRVLFTTSPDLYQASLQAAIMHPEVTVLNCSLNKPHRYVRSYYARMHEAMFVAGAIAASLSETGELGYVCRYPIYGQIACINAFALGAEMVCPNSRVHLEWSSVGDYPAAIHRLSEKGIDLIASVETVRLNETDPGISGLFRMHGETMESLAVPSWNWKVYYEEIMRRILDGRFRQEYDDSHKALNDYWGMPSGLVDICCTDGAPQSSHRLCTILKEAIRKGGVNPFAGVLHTQDGREIVNAEERMTQEQSISMDYLVHNVIGELPVYHQLNEGARAVVDVMGVEKVVKES